MKALQVGTCDLKMYLKIIFLEAVAAFVYNLGLSLEKMVDKH